MKHRPIPNLLVNEIQRICSKIDKRDKDSCWYWLGGYSTRPQISIRCKMYLVSRILWKLVHGDDPGEMLVCHLCNNIECVNPRHLFLGTQKDNMEHCITSGRFVQNQNIKLTPNEVLSIKESSLTQKKLSEIHGVHETTIWRIQNYVSHVT